MQHSLVLIQQLWLVLQDLCHGQQAQVLEVLVSVLDEEAELGDAKLHGGVVVGQARHHGADALVQEGHGRGAVDEVGEGLDQLLPQSRLQWSQSTKLNTHTHGGGCGQY